MFNIIVRSSNPFVNHLYKHNDILADIIIAKNTATGSVTMSRRDDSITINCCSVMQVVYGSQAGGHAGIAGSPRNVDSDINLLIKFLKGA